MTRTLENVIDEWRSRQLAASRLEDSRVAKIVGEILADVQQAAEDYLRFVSERDARLRSHKGERYFRTRFPEWEAQGNARRNEKGEREYRLCIVPSRANVVAARERGRNGEHAA